jgi:hypothetical protein
MQPLETNQPTIEVVWNVSCWRGVGCMTDVYHIGKNWSSFCALSHRKYNSVGPQTYPLRHGALSSLLVFSQTCEQTRQNQNCYNFSIKLNSIGVYVRANLTAQRPITKLAQIERKTQKYFKKIQNMIVYINYTNNTNNYTIFKNRLGRTFLVPNMSTSHGIS